MRENEGPFLRDDNMNVPDANSSHSGGKTGYVTFNFQIRQNKSAIAAGGKN